MPLVASTPVRWRYTAPAVLSPYGSLTSNACPASGVTADARPPAPSAV